MQKANKKNIGIVAVLVAVALLVGSLGYLTSGFKNWNVKTWLGKNETPKTENISGMVFTTSVGMAASAFNANGSTVLTATITPDNASNKLVDWSAEWVNPSATWASGKIVSNYVTVTPTADGALSATVDCVAPFATQIKIVATSRENSSATADCIVDYAKKVTGTSL